MIQPTSNRVFLFLTPSDMRKSYDTLAALVTQVDMNPLSGDLFVFTNRPRNRFKILLWETGGYWLCSKRLEAGIFAVPFVTSSDEAQAYTLEINMTELRLLIEGIELRNVKKSKRFALGNLQN
jgi:transposase